MSSHPAPPVPLPPQPQIRTQHLPTPPPQSDTLTAPHLLLTLHNQHQHLLDRVTPYTLYRWLFLVALVLLFFLRILLVEGFYIVCYVLFIFILNQFILFLQPKDRASLIAAASTTNPEQPALPVTTDDEFRPFVRRLPEFRFWHSTTIATALSILSTFFTMFDVPVYWPILLFYFVVLFVATMRRQWMDMRTLKYVPWDIGTKKVYKSNPKKVSVTTTKAPGPPPSAPIASTQTHRAPPPPPVPMLNVANKPS